MTMRRNLLGCRAIATPLFRGLLLLAIALLPFHRALNAQCVGPAISERNVAVKLLTTTLAKWGGQSAWSQVRTAETQGTVLRPQAVTPRTIDWFDDLSVTPISHRRDLSNVDGTITPRTVTESEVRQIAVNGKSYFSATQDEADMMLRHLPALALTRLLASEEYRFLLQKSTVGDETCVRVLSNAPYFSELWTFSSVDGSLFSVAYKNYNPVSPATQSWTTIRYKAMRSEGPLLLPQVVTAESTSATMQYTFTSHRFNTAFTAMQPGQSGANK